MAVDARGSFGPGVVFGKYRGTNVARERIRTPIRRTDSEQAARDRLARGARAWGDLTELQREEWAVYAETIDRIDPFGNIYHVTGQCEFMGDYAITMIVDEARPTGPPEWEPPGEIEGLRVSWNEQSERVWTSWTGEQEIEYVELFFTPLMLGGRMSTSSHMLTMHAVRGIGHDHYSGPYLPGAKKVIFKIRGLMSNGQRGPWARGLVPPGYP